ncbi:nucleotidyltransferase domain-containing protein [Verrucomicrobiota bacterium]
MVMMTEIRRYVRRLAKDFAPERVVLFGSYADGSATADSDVDLLVVMDHTGRNVEQSVTIDRALDRSFPLDLIVRKPAEVRRRLGTGDVFLSSIIAGGRTLYERGRQRVGRQGRRRLQHRIA